MKEFDIDANTIGGDSWQVRCAYHRRGEEQCNEPADTCELAEAGRAAFNRILAQPGGDGGRIYGALCPLHRAAWKRGRDKHAEDLRAVEDRMRDVYKAAVRNEQIGPEYAMGEVHPAMRNDESFRRWAGDWLAWWRKAEQGKGRR